MTRPMKASGVPVGASGGAGGYPSIPSRAVASTGVLGASFRKAESVRRKAGPRVPEKVVQRQCVHLLRSLGGLVWVLGTSRPRTDQHRGTCQTPGLPDVIAAVKGRMVMLECKAAGGRLRPEQAVFRQACQDCGVHHIVGGVEDVYRWLVQEGLVKPDHVPHGRRNG